MKSELVEGVPCRGRRNGIYTQRAAAITARGSIPTPSANQKLSRLDRLVQGFAHPGT